MMLSIPPPPILFVSCGGGGGGGGGGGCLIVSVVPPLPPGFRIVVSLRTGGFLPCRAVSTLPPLPPVPPPLPGPVGLKQLATPKLNRAMNETTASVLIVFILSYEFRNSS